MIQRIRKALKAEHGFADVYIIGMVGIMFLLGMGLVVVNFGYQSGAVTATKALTTAVTSRAQEYASALNQNLAVPVVPSQAQECVGQPVICTTVKSDVASGTDTRTITVVATAPYHQMTLTRQIDLNATETTHVSGLDAQGNPTWVNSDEGASFKIWGVAQSSIVGVPLPAQAGPDTPNSWNSVTARAGVDANGDLWVWGANDQCQAGSGTTTGTPITPVKLSTGGKTFVTVVGDASDEFAIDENGNVYGWGVNSAGELGNGTTTAVCSPTLLSGHHFLQMTVANHTAFGIDINKKLWAWGAGSGGQLGNGTTTAAQTTPVAIAPSSTFVAVATSEATTYAIDTTLKLWSWGGNGSGQMGDGTTTANKTASAVGLATKFTHIAAGNQTGYGIDSNGQLWAWGLNSAGQIGDATTTNRTTPVKVAAGTVYTQVSGGNMRAFAITSTGQLQAWGDNTNGALGNGSTGAVKTPSTILPSSHFNDVVSDYASNIAVARDTKHALWAVGPTPGNHGVWASNATTSIGTPLRMPAPDGFGVPAWN